MAKHTTNLSWPADEWEDARKCAFRTEQSLTSFIRAAVRDAVALDRRVASEYDPMTQPPAPKLVWDERKQKAVPSLPKEQSV